MNSNRFTPPRTADTPLTAKEARFVDEYLVNRNGADAARKAGYARASAKVRASRLLDQPNVQAAVEEGEAQWLARVQATRERRIRDIEAAANLDIGDLVDRRGNLIALKALPPHVRRAIVSVKVVKRNLTTGDGKVDEVLEVKLIDKGRMHELLARIEGHDKGDSQGPQEPIPVFVLPEGTTGVSVH